MEEDGSYRSSRRKWLGLGLLPILVAIGVLVSRAPSGGGQGSRQKIARGMELVKQGKSRQALALVADVSPDGAWKADLLTVRGLALSTLGQIEPSRLALEESIALQPDQAMVDKVLAAIYFSRNESARGIEYLEKAAKLDPGDFRPWYAIGEAFVRLGKPEDAGKAFGYALDRNRNHLESKIGLASVLVVTRPPEESAALIGELLTSRPDDPKVHVLAAWRERALGHADQSRQHIDRAVELAPDLVEAVAFRAQLNRATGKPQEALADAERAVSLDPNSLPALNLLAQLQAAAGRGEESRATQARHRKVLERAEMVRKLTAEIETRPTDPEPRSKLGQLAAESGLAHMARQSYLSALAIDPSYQPALDGLRALGPAAGEGAPASAPPSLLPMIQP